MADIIVSGALANKPFNGGNAWSRLGWVLGFKRLGFDVFFVEQISRAQCVDRHGANTTFADSVNLAYFRSTLDEFGLSNAAALICENGQEAWGTPMMELLARSQRAELLFNFGGHLNHPGIMAGPARRLYYDDDPGFTQFWHALGEKEVAGHDHYFTIGRNIGSPDCEIPCADIRWEHTRPPVVLERWPVGSPRALDRFTTVASWRGAYGPIEFGGKRYGAKVHEFRKFIELPRRCPHGFEVALDIHPADRKDLDALVGHGWRIVKPREVAASPQAYQRYLQASGAEFSVAQGIYVDSRSGWVSDRTVRYLASGRPALVQDTGFRDHLAAAGGLVTFRTLDEAVEGAEEIAGNYEKHCVAARRLAEDYFDSDQVIGELLAKIGLSVPRVNQSPSSR